MHVARSAPLLLAPLNYDNFAIYLIYTTGTGCGPHVFWGSGDKGYLFSVSWEALVIIFRDLRSNLMVLGISKVLQKVNWTVD